MKQILDWISSDPGFWPTALFMPAAVFLTILHFIGPYGRMIRLLWLSLLLASLVAVAMSLYVSYAYALIPEYSEHLEPAIASISWYLWEGKPVYHEPTSPELYSLLYGPYLFIINGLANGLLGPSLAASKISGPSSIALAIILFYFVARRIADWQSSLVATGLLACCALHSGEIAFAARADPLLILFVCTGLLAATASSWATSLLLGVMIGLSIGLKIHAFVYFIPVIAVAYTFGFSITQISLSFAVALITTLLPFAIMSNISLTNYLLTLENASAHSLNVYTYLTVARWLGVIVLPFAIVWVLFTITNPYHASKSLQKNKFILMALALGSIFLMPVASKIGSGQSHWLPMTPVFLFVYLKLIRDGYIFSHSRSVVNISLISVAASTIACLYISAFFQANKLTAKFSVQNREKAMNLLAELQEIIAELGPTNVLLFGVTDTTHYPVAYTRSLLVFDGQPIGVDPVALMESRQAGVNGPSLEVSEKFLSPHQELPAGIMWILPRNGEPFSMTSGYSSDVPLYNNAYRTSFKERFLLYRSTPNYAIWKLRPHA